MEYSIRKLSELAGVSARTLRYYDEIGLLKPMYVSEAGYRFYGEKEVALLQQILFYRERGLDLKSIKKILYQKDFDILNALKEHLLELEEQRKHTESLILTIKYTILSLEGEYEMSDTEKFEAFKKNVIKENEEKYGKEIRKAYGDETIDASTQKMLNMSQEAWTNFKELEEVIQKKLEDCVTSGIEVESEEAKEVVKLHKAWLLKTWKEYTAQAHMGVAKMYVADERFKQYYDKNISGCAAFLERAICHWAVALAEESC